MSLKAVIVGCGQIAEAHIEELAKLPEVTVTAVCDLEILMAQQVAIRFEVPSYYSDYLEMLDKEKPDVVHITTPPQSHLSLARQAIEAGCHVYVEKPLALNSEDADSLIRLAETAGKKLTIGYTYLFDPPANIMRQLVDRGVLGRAVHIESYYGYNLAGPFGAAILGSASHWVHRLPGRLFHNNIDHMLYKITEFIKDGEPDVTAFGYKLRPGSAGDVRDEMMDELRVFIRGREASAFGTFCSHARPVSQQLKIYGTESIIYLDYVARTVTVDTAGKVPSSLGRLLPSFGTGFQYIKNGFRNVFRFMKSDFHFFAGFNHLLRLFYESIRTDGPPPIEYREISRINKLMDEIFRQLNQGSDAP